MGIEKGEIEGRPPLVRKLYSEIEHEVGRIFQVRSETSVGNMLRGMDRLNPEELHFVVKAAELAGRLVTETPQTMAEVFEEVYNDREKYVDFFWMCPNVLQEPSALGDGFSDTKKFIYSVVWFLSGRDSGLKFSDRLARDMLDIISEEARLKENLLRGQQSDQTGNAAI
jgi:hypothetical protein